MSLQHDERTIDLDIEGMTCASCVARVERRLERLDGVHAEVNLATERARVRFAPSIEVGDLVDAVRAAGYVARVPDPVGSPATDAAPLRLGDPDAAPAAPAVAAAASGGPTAVPDRGPSAGDPLRRRLAVSAVLTAPVVVLAMVPALQFPGWQWVSLVLATPVVLWGGWPFHRAAAVNLRHGSLTMDTLVSLGTLTAYLWSLWALGFGDAGMLGMTHGWTFGVRGEPGGDLYLEVAAGVVTLLLLGRAIEARSKRQAGASLRALLDLAPREVTLVVGGDDDPTVSREAARSACRPGRSARVRSSSRDPASASPPTGSSSTARRASTRACSRASPHRSTWRPGRA